MNTRILRNIVFAFLIFGIFGSACSEGTGGYNSTYVNGVGFQYNLPSDFCRIITTESNIQELYCTEGKVVIEITDETYQESKLKNVLGDIQALPDLYNFSVERSKSGNKQDIQVAKFISLEELDLEHNEYPYYIAVSTFGPNKTFIAKGFLYNREFELKFTDIFMTVVRSFEPFSPP